MRVVFKFALAFFLVSCVCLGLSRWLFVSREAARLERIITTGLTSYGAGLRDAIEGAWRDHGVEGARAVVSGFDDHSEIRARFSTVPGPSEMTIESVPSDDLRRVTVTFPVRGPDGARSGTLSLERNVASGPALIRAELGVQMVVALSLALGMTLIAAILGTFVIGRPLARIVAQARRIGAGDLTGRLNATSTDEIGVLKRELNAMCDRLGDAYDRLEEEAAARLETLEQLRHLDRLRTVGTIASSIAHELGTPLNVLLLRGQSLASNDVPPDEVAASGKAVVTQVEKMSAIVRQLLDFTRARKRLPAQAAEVELRKVAEHACRLLVSIARKHHVSLDVKAESDVRVRGDFEQIEQALTNLIVNAIHAMPGGGAITVRVTEEDKAPGAVPVGAIEIADEGGGMTAEVLERIFEPFFTTKVSGDGTGLGLHVARGIAEDHGGSITVRSQVGKGSAFTMKLPRST